MRNKSLAFGFVAIQLLGIAALLVSGHIIAISVPGILVEMTGLTLGLAAIWHMGIGNFNISPNPRQGARFIRTGPYHLIRHPMYLAQLIALLPLVVEKFSWPRLLIWFVLLVDLLLKIQYEEKQLLLSFPEYKEYQQKSWRLIPYVY